MNLCPLGFCIVSTAGELEQQIYCKKASTFALNFECWHNISIKTSVNMQWSISCYYSTFVPKNEIILKATIAWKSTTITDLSVYRHLARVYWGLFDHHTMLHGCRDGNFAHKPVWNVAETQKIGNKATESRKNIKFSTESRKRTPYNPPPHYNDHGHDAHDSEFWIWQLIHINPCQIHFVARQYTSFIALKAVPQTNNKSNVTVVL